MWENGVNMPKEEKPSYYAIIPANVRYDKNLSANAKLLYGEITALCNDKGFCWASNKYFANLYGVSLRSISRWISILTEKGYIYSEEECEDKFSRRLIGLVLPGQKSRHYDAPDKNAHAPPRQKCLPSPTTILSIPLRQYCLYPTTKMSTPPRQKCLTEYYRLILQLISQSVSQIR